MCWCEWQCQLIIDFCHDTLVRVPPRFAYKELSPSHTTFCIQRGSSVCGSQALARVLVYWSMIKWCGSDVTHLLMFSRRYHLSFADILFTTGNILFRATCFSESVGKARAHTSLFRRFFVWIWLKLLLIDSVMVAAQIYMSATLSRPCDGFLKLTVWKTLCFGTVPKY